MPMLDNKKKYHIALGRLSVGGPTKNRYYKTAYTFATFFIVNLWIKSHPFISFHWFYKSVMFHEICPAPNKSSQN
jgi:hypothetical protein